MNDPLREYLEKHPDHDKNPERVNIKTLRSWLAEADRHARAGARCAYLLGRALLAKRAKVQHGEVAEWTAKQARRLGRSPRTIRLYVQLAAAINDPQLATPLPISILDRPLRDVPRAIRAVKAGCDPDAPTPKATKVPKVQQWRKKAKNLLTSIPRGASRKDLLRAHFLAVFHELLQIDPGLAPAGMSADVEDDRHDFSFAAAAAAAVQKEKPLPASVLKARKKVLPLFSYPGGKSRIVDNIIDAIGALQADGGYGDYVLREPFVGGGSVSINMLATGRAKRVWLNDAEPGVVAAWNAVLHDHELFAARVADLPARPTKETVRELAAQVQCGQLSGLDLAVAEVLLRQCTMDADRKSYSQFKVNKQWNPNTFAKRIHQLHRLLDGRVEHGECTMLDAAEVIAAPGPCFLWLDPPYVAAGPSKYPQPFTEELHRQLAVDLNATGQPWLLSYDDHPLVLELYAHQIIKPVEVRGSRQRKQELLICPTRYPEILRPDHDPDLIGELFGVECGVEPPAPPPRTKKSAERDPSK